MVTCGFGGAWGAVRTLAQAQGPALLAGQEKPVPTACPQPQHRTVKQQGHSKWGCSLSPHFPTKYLCSDRVVSKGA